MLIERKTTESLQMEIFADFRLLKKKEEKGLL